MATSAFVYAYFPKKNDAAEMQDLEINVNFGIFFDGTNNHRIQVLIGSYQREKEKLLEKEDEDMIQSFSLEPKVMYDIVDGLSKKRSIDSTIDVIDVISKEYESDNSGDMRDDDFTNIARMEPFFSPALNPNEDLPTYNYRIYVTGSGTEKDLKKGDNNNGLAFGQGGTGVIQKVVDALDAIYTETEFIRRKGINKVKYKIYLFGFSRGSTSARLFVDLCNERGDRPRVLKNVIKKYNEKYNNISNEDKIVFPCQNGTEVEFPFVGIFDTVSSVGANDNSKWNYVSGNWVERFLPVASSLHHQNVEDLGLNTMVSDTKVKKIVHICALDEYRENFGLVQVEKAEKVEQMFIPGAHTDIGGGYRPSRPVKTEKTEDPPIIIIPKYITSQKDNVKHYFKIPYVKSNGGMDNIAISMDELSSIGWLDNAMVIEDTDKNLTVKKGTKGGYQFLPLQIMVNRCPDCFKIEISEKFNIPDDLPNVNFMIRKNGTKQCVNWIRYSSNNFDYYYPSDEDYKKLRFDYLHFSSDLKRRYKLVAVNGPNYNDEYIFERIIY